MPTPVERIELPDVTPEFQAAYDIAKVYGVTITTRQLNQAKGIIAAALQPQGWQDISSAPKDERKFWVWAQGYEPRLAYLQPNHWVEADWKEKGYASHDLRDANGRGFKYQNGWEPTHWCQAYPLPPVEGR